MKGHARLFAVVATALLACHPAYAHTGAGVAGGFSSGFLHPLTGIDHLIAMVAVGLWGAQLGLPAIWVLPVAFPLVMAFGGLLGITGVYLPGQETMIALSAIGLGLVVALRVRPPLWAACLLVSVFAIFHGYAHGRELPAAADPAAYATGFVLATGMLHLCGIVIGLLDTRAWGSAGIRTMGGAIAACGVVFLVFGGPG